MTSITLLDDWLEQQKADAPLRALITTMGKACRHISDTVRQGAAGNILGSEGTENVQGEIQKKLDVIANQILLDAYAGHGATAALASEEMADLHPVAGSEDAPYLLLFDPLDGSSNIDVNVSIGTIFSVLKAPEARQGGPLTNASFLQPGHSQVAAGYAIYGPQTLLVLSLGSGVACFTLMQDGQGWLLVDDALRIPADTSEFAINMSNMRHWHAPVRRYIDECLAGREGPQEKDWNMRWVASMVADVHRVLTRGGLFMYPPDQRPSVRQGKLRLLYEASPMAFIVEQAGGAATDGCERILNLGPQALHQRTGVVLGSRNEVERLRRYHLDKPA